MLPLVMVCVAGAAALLPPCQPSLAEKRRQLQHNSTQGHTSATTENSWRSQPAWHAKDGNSMRALGNRALTMIQHDAVNDVFRLCSEKYCLNCTCTGQAEMLGRH